MWKNFAAPLVCEVKGLAILSNIFILFLTLLEQEKIAGPIGEFCKCFLSLPTDIRITYVLCTVCRRAVIVGPSTVLLGTLV